MAQSRSKSPSTPEAAGASSVFRSDGPLISNVRGH